MLALVVPSATEADLFYQFLRLRDSWPQQAIEIKGSKLKEDQAAQVIDLLAAHDVIAEFYGIDMARHPTDIIGHGSMSPSIILFRGVQVSSGGLYGRIDRKDRTVTEMERLWSTLILPIGEPRSAERPLARVEGFD